MKPIEFLRRPSESAAPPRREAVRSRGRQPRRAPRPAGEGSAHLLRSRGGEPAASPPSPPPDPRLRNRRKPNVPRLLLRVALVLLAAECVAVLLCSPRLWVRTLRVEGNRTVPAARIFERTGLRPQTSIVLLHTGWLRARIEREPAIASVEVSRRLPGTVIVRVQERKPWAVVKTNGVCYTVDETLVPFRKDRTPAPDLPLLVLADSHAAAPRLGKQMQTPGIGPAKKCLIWAASHPGFPLARIAVDPGGKLCLNRKNGGEVRLGTGKDLDKKLNSLALLLEERPDVRAGSFAYINLYAHDAPALHPLLEPAAESPEDRASARPDDR